MTQDYSAVAGPNVPVPQRRRRDRVLVALRHAEAPITVAELVAHFRANRMPDYNADLAGKDLRQLERYHLARNVGHPKRWSAVR